MKKVKIVVLASLLSCLNLESYATYYVVNNSQTQVYFDISNQGWGCNSGDQLVDPGHCVAYTSGPLCSTYLTEHVWAAPNNNGDDFDVTTIGGANSTFIVTGPGENDWYWGSPNGPAGGCH